MLHSLVRNNNPEVILPLHYNNEDYTYIIIRYLAIFLRGDLCIRTLLFTIALETF